MLCTEQCLTQDTLEYTFNLLSLYSRYVVERVCKRWRNASIFGTYLIKILIIDKNTNIQYINILLLDQVYWE